MDRDRVGVEVYSWVRGILRNRVWLEFGVWERVVGGYVLKVGGGNCEGYGDEKVVG